MTALAECYHIQALYEEGRIEEASQLLSEYPSELWTNPDTPYLNIAYIYAEICHDKGRYSEAAPIFEAVAARCHDMAKARFGAASCYLQEAIDLLRSRMEIYRIRHEERDKYNKYLKNLTGALALVQSTGWHTVWNQEACRNLRLPSYSKLH